MKRKYADIYYSVQKTNKGWTWKIFFEFKKGSEVAQTSLDNEDDEDKYFKTPTAARTDAIEAIQDHYS